jgi:hypothetical protein
MLLILVEWAAWFIYNGMHHSIPAIGPDQSQVLGTVIFNYAFVVSVPSWLNEKVGNFLLFISLTPPFVF